MCNVVEREILSIGHFVQDQGYFPVFVLALGGACARAWARRGSGHQGFPERSVGKNAVTRALSGVEPSGSFPLLEEYRYGAPRFCRIACARL